MYDIQNKLAPVHSQNLFKHVSDIHSYNTRSATADKFYIMSSRPWSTKEFIFPIWRTAMEFFAG